MFSVFMPLKNLNIKIITIFNMLYIYFVFRLTFMYYRENVILNVSVFFGMTYYPDLFLQGHFSMT